MMADAQARVMLICCPRSTSTLLTRALGSVPGSQIFMDSHYFCFETENNLKGMGKPVDYDLPDEDWRKAAEMLVGEDCSMDKVDISKLKYPVLMDALDKPRAEAPFVICKTVCQPIVGRYDLLPDASSRYKYSFLLRHPLRVFTSYRKALFDVVSQLPLASASFEYQRPKSWEQFHFQRDVPQKFIYAGRLFKELYDVWKYVTENIDPNPVIIDSDELLSDPDRMIPRYCSAMGIPYSTSMLAWDQGDPHHAEKWWQPFKSVCELRWGRIFFGNAVVSKGFLKPERLPTLEEVSFDVKESYELVKPYYEEMYNARTRFINN